MFVVRGFLWYFKVVLNVLYFLFLWEKNVDIRLIILVVVFNSVFYLKINWFFF